MHGQKLYFALVLGPIWEQRWSETVHHSASGASLSAVHSCSECAAGHQTAANHFSVVTHVRPAQLPGGAWVGHCTGNCPFVNLASSVLLCQQSALFLHSCSECAAGHQITANHLSAVTRTSSCCPQQHHHKTQQDMVVVL